MKSLLLSSRLLCSLALAGALAGCAIPGPNAPDQHPSGAGTESSTTPAGYRQEPAADGSGPVLYARDGSPVAGAVGPSSLGARDLSSGALGAHQPDESGGRMYILELYQRVIEERDTLAQEVAALNVELDQTRRALAAADHRITELETQVTSLDAIRQGLVNENVELAGRLTTAQIRRLQAEKILLEESLADLRVARGEEGDMQLPNRAGEEEQQP